MSDMSTKLDPERLADLSRDPLWSPRRYPVIPPALPGFKATKGITYTDMISPTLGGEIKVGFDFDNHEWAEDHSADLAVLAEVWAEVRTGTLDLGIHLETTSLSLIQYELRRHLIDKAAREREA